MVWFNKNILKASLGFSENEVFLESEESKQNYQTLHSCPGALKVFVSSILIVVKDPTKLHRFCQFIFVQEESIHGTSDRVFGCLRAKLGSGPIFNKLVDHFKGGVKIK